MRIPILAAIPLLVFSLRALGEETKAIIAESGSPRIDQLVSALVSQSPAPLQNGGRVPKSGIFAEDSLLNQLGQRCATDAVEQAFQRLKKISPKEYGYLLKHQNDDRYSFSTIEPWGSPIMSGWINYSVGHAIDQILSNEMSTWIGGYKSREGADGKGCTPVSFGDYVEAQGGYEKWVASVSALTRTEIDLRFLKWCIEIEEARGFEDGESRKKVLEGYHTKVKEIEKATTNSQDKSEGERILHPEPTKGSR
jgi:hypothetical protein